MSAGIQHLVHGNKNRVGEGRIDKMETDRFNSIVERISGVNPSKLASEVTGAPVETRFGPQSRAMVERASGPGPQLGSKPPWEEGSSKGGNDGQLVQKLANKVAMLEQRLAKYEVFNGDDNDVVVTARSKPQSPSNRGPDSITFARDIDPKKAKQKDPADGKPDAPKKGAQMAGEHINILGISMTEWREMAGLKSQPVDLTQPKRISEEIEDEVEGLEVETANEPVTDTSVVEHQLWAEFLRLYNSTPEDFAAFVEAADQIGDVEAIEGIQAIEDEFQKHLETYLSGGSSEQETIDQGDIAKEWVEWLFARGLTVEMFDSLVDAAETDEDLETLEQLQAMFEAEIAGKRVAGSSPVPGGESEIHQPGKAPIRTVSVARGEIKPAQKNVPGLPKYMRKKMGMPVDDSKNEAMDAFECDADETGHPDMKHPGWAKAMKRFKISRKKGK